MRNGEKESERGKDMKRREMERVNKDEKEEEKYWS